MRPDQQAAGETLDAILRDPRYAAMPPQFQLLYWETCKALFDGAFAKLAPSSEKPKRKPIAPKYGGVIVFE